MSEDKRRVEATLTPELYSKLQKLKSKLGFVTDAQGIRTSIFVAYRNVVEKEDC